MLLRSNVFEGYVAFYLLARKYSLFIPAYEDTNVGVDFGRHGDALCFFVSKERSSSSHEIGNGSIVIVDHILDCWISRRRGENMDEE